MHTETELVEALSWLASAPRGDGRTRMIDRVLDELAEVRANA